MTKRPDVYTTLGQECGCCGHRHPTARQAGRCLEDYRQREFSDRIVVAVAADAAWPPTEGRYLNDAELEALYEGAGNGLRSRPWYCWATLNSPVTAYEFIGM